MDKRGFQSSTSYVLKRNCGSGCAVQEPEYYDKIMLLIEAKFIEILKLGKTIDDELKTVKIPRVIDSLGSSGMLKNKKIICVGRFL